MPVLRVVAVLLVVAACHSSLHAQVQQGAAAAGKLTPGTANAEAAAAFTSALEANLVWDFGGSGRNAARAVELDPAFGLARMLRASVVGGPDAAAEFSRAAVDGASASALEALMTLGAREVNAGRVAAGRRIYAAAAALAPNDPRVAVWHANSLVGAERIAALREAARNYPGDVPARVWLAFYLTPANDTIAQANGAEAISIAQEAVRLAPRLSATHTVYGHVLVRTGRFAEAKQHLTAATTLEHRAEYAYQLLGQIASMENRQPEFRHAMDSAIALSANVATIRSYRRARALVHLSEGKPQLAMDELAEVARSDEGTNRPAAALTHLFMATVAAATRDSIVAEQHLQVARDLGATGTTLHDYELGVYTLTGQSGKARAALENYIRVNGPRPELSADVNALRTALVHRMTGQVLLTEGKPMEAIAELKRAPENPYVTVFLVEAYRTMKDDRQADAVLKAFFERGALSYASSGVPVIRYRSSRQVR